jgi:hypothetical protein
VALVADETELGHPALRVKNSLEIGVETRDSDRARPTDHAGEGRHNSTHAGRTGHVPGTDVPYR